MKTENATPNAWVYVDIKTSDIGGYVRGSEETGRENSQDTEQAIRWSGPASSNTWNVPPRA